jgi:NAD(P)-dependent dehydrogenase (short-subunit alcohol dehydrogenase family)
MNYLESIFGLNNKVVVITGGTGILGSAMASGFLYAGAAVVLLGTNDEKIKRVVDILKPIGGPVVGFKCNVLDEESVAAAHQAILSRFDRIDVLVNAAGGNLPGATVGVDQTIFDLQMKEFTQVVDLNLNGTVLPTLVMGKTMTKQQSGSIINISSMAATQAITRVVGYSAAKAAIDNFTRWMAVEFAQKFGNGIRVNAVAPGFLLTDQNRTLLTNPDGSLTARGLTIIAKTPFQRFGEPDELIGALLWLASDASKFVTGTVIPIDGGFSAFSGV